MTKMYNPCKITIFVIYSLIIACLPLRTIQAQGNPALLQNFTGKGYDSDGNTNTDGRADPVLAVGTSSIIECVNTSMTIFDKSGNLESSSYFQDFFGDEISNTNTNVKSIDDPKIVYDQYSDCYIVAILALEQKQVVEIVNYINTNVTMDLDCYFYIAVSKGSNPTSDPNDWYKYSIPAKQELNNTNTITVADYTGLGFDQNYIYVTAGLSTQDQLTLEGSIIFQIDKEELETGTLDLINTFMSRIII